MTIEDNKISSLYQQGNDAVPPVQLDSAILGAAREATAKAAERTTEKTASTATGEQVATAKSPFSGSWPATASIAAVLVLAVILVPLISQEVPVTEMSATEMPVTLESKAIEDRLNFNLEQDSAGRYNAEQSDMKAKQRSLHKVQQTDFEVQKKLRLYSTPVDTMSRERQKFSEEVAPLRSAKPSLQHETIVPSPATGISSQPAREAKPSDKNLPQMPQMFEADDIQPATADIVQSSSISVPAPKLWLEEIRQLISQGELKSAQLEFDAFKTHYPDEEVDQLILHGLDGRSGR